MDYLLLPPEINSARMYAGPGAGPLLEAATAWQGLATQLSSTASDITAEISQLESVWSGPSSQEMATTLTRYVTWLTTTAGQASESASQAMAAVGAYEMAYAATVPPPVIAANRALLAVLVSTNFLGCNTAAIMATEAHYAEMWAQDVAAMTGYHAASAQATALPAFSPPAGLDIFAPGSNTETTGLAGLLNLFSGASGSAFGTFINANQFSSGYYYAIPLQGFQGLVQFVGLGSLGQGQQQIEIAQANAQPSNISPYPLPGPGDPSADVPGATGAGTSATGSLGSASKVGALSTPGSWGQAANPRLVAAEYAGTPEAAAPMGGVAPAAFGAPGVSGPSNSRSKTYGMPVKVVPRQVGS